MELGIDFSDNINNVVDEVEKIIKNFFKFYLNPIDIFISLCYNIFTIKRKVVRFMKLNYEVEWELGDEVIDNIVKEVENTIKQYPEDDVDDCILGIIEDNLSDMDYDECDHFNMDCYLDKVAEEVKKRYLDQKQKATVSPATIKATGIVRRIDDLGRIVIPKEIRRAMRIYEGDPLEIFFDTDHNIVLKKYHG